VHAGQIIFHFKEDKLYSKGKQEDEDDDVVCTHCQPSVTASQTVASELQSFGEYYLHIVLPQMPLTSIIHHVTYSQCLFLKWFQVLQKHQAHMK
jgi:hypothetical protein